MLKKVLIFIFCLLVMLPQESHADVKVKQLLLMSPEDIGRLLEAEKGTKSVYVVMKTDCLPCHEKFLSLLTLKPEERDRVTAIFLSDRAVGFKRYMNSFKEIPLRIIYNKGSEYDLAKVLKNYGVRPWTTVPRVILFDENVRVFGQGAHTADKISIFLSGQEPVIAHE